MNATLIAAIIGAVGIVIAASIGAWQSGRSHSYNELLTAIRQITERSDQELARVVTEALAKVLDARDRGPIIGRAVAEEIGPVIGRYILEELRRLIAADAKGKGRRRWYDELGEE